MNKISNQTVHHQSPTKFDSMLQDIKKLQACKTKNTFYISDISDIVQKKLLIFLIMSIQTTGSPSALRVGSGFRGHLAGIY